MVSIKYERFIFGYECILNINGVWYNCGFGNLVYRLSYILGKIKIELSWLFFFCIDMRGILS